MDDKNGLTTSKSASAFRCSIYKNMIMRESSEEPRAMAKSSKLIAEKAGKVLLVRRRRDRLWMFPGGRKRLREDDKGCLRREIKEELPKLKLGRLRLWKEIKSRNQRSGCKMSDAIFIARKFPVSW